MTSQEYIFQELNEFIVKFPQTRVRYEYDALSDVHFIEVVPNRVYHLDEAYINWEAEMYDKFVAVFPNQNICFISDDAMVGLENANFELVGLGFEPIYSYNREDILPEVSVVRVADFISSYNTLQITSNKDVSPKTQTITIPGVVDCSYSFAA